MNFSTLLVLLAAFVPLFVLLLAAVIDRKRRKDTEKPPQQEKLLRPAGHSLSIRLNETLDRVLFDLLWACGLCGIAGAIGITTFQLLRAQVPVLWPAASALLLAAFVAAAAFFALHAFRRLREVDDIRLGMRGEQAVAEVLHEVAECGFRAFHDLPGGENWNIDHVAVGTRGVFLIETKARRRRKVRKGKPVHVVRYDGTVLRFPSGYDSDAVPQAQRNAKWLSQYLRKKTGEPVFVEPLVVVPGWFVEFVTRGDFAVKVMNASYLAGFFRGQNQTIGAAQVRRIIAALDEKCRDVEF